MSRHIFQRQGLVTADGQPGLDWGEFTRSFDRTDPAAMETLGRLAGYVAREMVETTDARTDVAQRFAEAAQPPIISPDGASPEALGAMAFYDAVQDVLEESPEVTHVGYAGVL